MNTYDRINSLRKQKGVTFSFLNEKIGGYRGKMTDVKNGKVSLTESEIDIIAKELGTTSEYLISGEASEKNPAPENGDGLSRTQYDELTPENWAAVDAVIARLYASQSRVIKGCGFFLTLPTVCGFSFLSA